MYVVIVYMPHIVGNKKGESTSEELCEATPCTVTCEDSIVEWGECEGCARWFHQFCVKVTTVNNWFCDDCV